MGKDKKQTTTQRLDPASQGHVDATRRQATSAADIALNQPGSFFEGADPRSIQDQINQFLNPFTESVIGGVNQQFDQARGAATRATNQGAAAAGAFGGARHGVTEGTRLSNLDRDQAGVVGGILSNQFNTAVGQGLQFSEYQRALRERQRQEPLFRNQAAQGFFTGGLGPVGGTTEQVTPGNLVGDLAGVALTGAGFLAGGPAGAAGAQALQGGGGGGFTAPQFLPQANFNPLSRFGR